MPKKLRLEGLDCASCAYEIEDALKKEGFEHAAVSFATKEAVIEGDIERAKRIIKRVEPDVRVLEEDGGAEEGHEESPKEMLYFIVPSLVLFIAGIIMHYHFGMDGGLVFGIFLGSYVLTGWKVLRNAGMNVLHGRAFDENSLIVIATVGAFLIRQYPEGVAVMLFYVIGEFFQDIAVDRSRRSIRSLLSLKAEHANLLKDGDVVRVRPEDLRPGDVIIVRAGEKVPVDGVVMDGSSSLDTSALTGESIPRAVGKGDEVLSGMVNLNGLLRVKVTKELSESTISRILELVESASARKARTERFITRFARYYTPAVVALAAMVALIPPLLFGEPFQMWVYRALVLLVISCPCALVISIPLGYFGGIGRSAREGILVKGSNYLDALKDAGIVAFDKTGTLTKGVFKVREVETRNGHTDREVLEFAALAEAHSNHPIAKAIKDAYDGHIDEAGIREYQEMAGYGVVARIDGTEVMVGNDRLLHRFGIKHDTCHVKGTVVHVVINRRYAGYITISDEMKEDAPAAVERLKKLGVGKVVMLTGDSREVAKDVAEELKLDGFYAELLPEDKVRVVEELEKEKGEGSLIFVGDGINDAPVLARADVGVAMGALGSDAAIESADVVIMDDRPSKLPEGIRIARRTQGIVWQNIALALSVKVAFIGLGILGEATMWEAVFADVGVAMIAILNALRILR